MWCVSIGGWGYYLAWPATSQANLSCDAVLTFSDKWNLKRAEHILAAVRSAIWLPLVLQVMLDDSS